MLQFGSVPSSVVHAIEFGTLRISRSEPPAAAIANLLQTTTPPPARTAVLHHTFSSPPVASAAVVAIAPVSDRFSHSVLLTATGSGGSSGSGRASLHAAICHTIRQWQTGGKTDRDSKQSSSRDERFRFELPNEGGSVSIRVSRLTDPTASTAAAAEVVELSVGAPNALSIDRVFRAILCAAPAPPLPPHSIRVNYATAEYVARLKEVMRVITAEVKLARDWLSGHLQSVAEMKSRAAAKPAVSVLSKQSRELTDFDLKSSVRLVSA